MKWLLILFVVGLLAVSVWFFSGRNNPQINPKPPESITVPTATPAPAVSESPATPTPVSTTITYTDSGYSPATLIVKKGDTVTWINNNSSGMWTASAVHPTHKSYPGSDITFCTLSDKTPIIFDACKGYASGESWEFKFNEKGTWKYHNHLQSNHTGTIVVE